MKKIVLALALALFLGMPFGSDAAEIHSNPAGNVINQFTGKYWMNSTPENQEAYLFGIDTAVTVEAMHQRDTTGAKKAARQYTLSPFEKGWMEAFENMSRKEIIEQVDNWYKEHPDQIDRPVLGVIWYEIIKPRLAASK